MVINFFQKIAVVFFLLLFGDTTCFGSKISDFVTSVKRENGFLVRLVQDNRFSNKDIEIAYSLVTENKEEIDSKNILPKHYFIAQSIDKSINGKHL